MTINNILDRPGQESGFLHTHNAAGLHPSGNEQLADAGVSPAPGKQVRWLLALLLLSVLLFGQNSMAVLPEPSNFVFGSITISNVVAGADRVDLVVEARRTTNGVPVASYRIGDVAQYGSMYFLELPIETVPATRKGGALTNGTRLFITLRDESGDLAQASYVIPARGRFQQLDFTVGPAAPTSLYQQWLAQNGISGTGDGDKDGDGVSNSREYVAGSNPSDPKDVFSLQITNAAPGTTVSFLARKAEGVGYSGLARLYSLEASTNAALTGSWVGVSGFTNILGNNNRITYPQPGSSRLMYYRARVWLQ